MKPYIGHDSQLYGVEEHRLVGGKGDGMRILEVTNGKGIELAVTPDRAGDIKHSNADISKARKLLNYEPEWDFERGIKAAIAWYRENL